MISCIKKVMGVSRRESEREMEGEERHNLNIPAEGGGEEKKLQSLENHSVMKN